MTRKIIIEKPEDLLERIIEFIFQESSEGEKRGTSLGFSYLFTGMMGLQEILNKAESIDDSLVKNIHIDQHSNYIELDGNKMQRLRLVHNPEFDHIKILGLLGPKGYEPISSYTTILMQHTKQLAIFELKSHKLND